MSTAVGGNKSSNDDAKEIEPRGPTGGKQLAQGVRLSDRECTENTHVGVDVVLVHAVPAADVLLAGEVFLPLLARGTDVFQNERKHAQKREPKEKGTKNEKRMVRKM